MGIPSKGSGGLTLHYMWVSHVEALEVFFKASTWDLGCLDLITKLHNYILVDTLIDMTFYCKQMILMVP